MISSCVGARSAPPSRSVAAAALRSRAPAAAGGPLGHRARRGGRSWVGTGRSRGLTSPVSSAHELAQHCLGGQPRPAAAGARRRPAARPPSAPGHGWPGAGARGGPGRPGRARPGRAGPRCRSGWPARRRSRPGCGSDSIRLRRAAHSPASGWTTPASSGHHRLSSGRATSSVTRPPSVEVGAVGLGANPVVEALDQADLLVGQQRPEQPGDEVRAPLGSGRRRRRPAGRRVVTNSDFHSASPLPG